MQIVKGGAAGIAMKHGIGRVVKKFPPEVRMSKKDKARLDLIVAKANRVGAAKRVAARNGVHVEAPVETLPTAPDFTPLPTQRLLGEEHLAFFKRIAEDPRIPRDIRVEAFSYTLYTQSEE